MLTIQILVIALCFCQGAGVCKLKGTCILPFHNFAVSQLCSGGFMMQ